MGFQRTLYSILGSYLILFGLFQIASFLLGKEELVIFGVSGWFKIIIILLAFLVAGLIYIFLGLKKIRGNKLTIWSSILGLVGHLGAVAAILLISRCSDEGFCRLAETFYLLVPSIILIALSIGLLVIGVVISIKTRHTSR